MYKKPPRWTDPGGVTNPLVSVGSQRVPQDPKIADFRSLLARVCAILVRSRRMRCHTKRLGRALRTRQLLLRSDQNYEHPACEHFFLAGIDRSWRCHEPTGAHGVSQDPKIADFRSLLARICAILVRSSSLRCHTKRLGRALRTRHHLLRSDKNCEHPARATIFLAGDRPILEVSRTQCHVGTPGRGGGRSWGGGGW